jgi:hypothetical protein
MFLEFLTFQWQLLAGCEHTSKIRHHSLVEDACLQ